MKKRCCVRITAYERPPSGLTPNLLTMAKKMTPATILQGRLKEDLKIGGQLYLESYLDGGFVLSPSLKCGPIKYVVANFVLTDRWICQIVKVPPLPKGVCEFTPMQSGKISPIHEE